MTVTSMHDKEISTKIQLMDGVTFYGVFMALLQMADTDNTIKLMVAFPEATKEALARYYAPGAALSLEEWADRFGVTLSTMDEDEAKGILLSIENAWNQASKVVNHA